MTLLERDEMMRKEGIEIGIKQGIEQEHKNTEMERARADSAEAAVREANERIKVLEERLRAKSQSKGE